MNIFLILLGVVLLFGGRKFFWFFVGAVGFIAGVTLVPLLLPGQPDWLFIIIALFAGLVGAAIAVFLQGLAIWIGGFLAGGYLTITFLNLINVQTGNLTWVPFVLGGIIGAALVIILFDWALIILSSLTGATLVVQNVQLAAYNATWIFFVLLIVGIGVQAAQMFAEGRRRERDVRTEE
jgi:MFS family permease